MFVSEVSDRGDQIECGPHRSLGIVLERDRSPPDRHHGVADELLERAAVAAHDRGGDVEVAGQHFPHLLRIALFRERGEADQVGKEDRDHATLGDRRCGSGRAGDQPVAALATEPLARLVGGATRPAGDRQCRATLSAESAAVTILTIATGADHPPSLPAHPFGGCPATPNPRKLEVTWTRCRHTMTSIRRPP